jgi:hypothetical protein
MNLITKYAFRGNCTTESEVDDGIDYVTVAGPCYSCQRPVSVRVVASDYVEFESGEFAQDCFPYLSAEQREFLISGICGTCWDEMFANPEEDE